MINNTVRWTGGALAGIAATVTALAAAPAHADVVGTGITVQGSNFQVGHAYTISVTGLTPGSYSQVMDTANGVTVVAYGISLDWTSTSASFPWIPTSTGTHTFSVVPAAPGTDSITFPSTAAFDSATVQVTGTGYSDPTTCSTFEPCMTLHGTPEVGCTLTAEFTPQFAGLDPMLYPTTRGNLLQPLSAAIGNPPVASTLTVDGQSPLKGTTTIQWTPTTAGYHLLQGGYTVAEGDTMIRIPPLSIDLPSGSSYIEIPSGSAMPGMEETADMYVPVAAAGTAPCAPVSSGATTGPLSQSAASTGSH